MVYKWQMVKTWCTNGLFPYESILRRTLMISQWHHSQHPAKVQAIQMYQSQCRHQIQPIHLPVWLPSTHRSTQANRPHTHQVSFYCCNSMEQQIVFPCYWCFVLWFVLILQLKSIRELRIKHCSCLTIIMRQFLNALFLTQLSHFNCLLLL